MKYRNLFFASSLLFCTGVIAAQVVPSPRMHTTENFLPGEKIPKEEYAAENYTYAGIQVEKECCYPNTYVTASFLYYYATEGGMDLAKSAATVLNRFLVNASTSNSRILTQDFAFKPGFKVGVGFGYDQSFFSMDYTWIRQTTHTNANAPSPGSGFPEGTTGSWVMNNWFEQIATESRQTVAATNINSEWQLGVDIGDLLITRAFYQGRDVVVQPFLGLRGAWIRQRMNVTITPPIGIFTGTVSSTITSKNTSNSWAIGPRAGIDASYLLGMGIRLEGGVAGSLLVTQYPHVRHEENVATLTVTPSTLATEIKNYNCVRPEVDLNIGLGWGRYLSQGRYHFDLAVDYDFIAFFEQNMIRKLLDETIAGTGAAASNLYFQGLNITARFDF
ncbi:MAG: Lpg1974 family pore-forming outer membrane protein [Chlamydiota bacterium]